MLLNDFMTVLRGGQPDILSIVAKVVSVIIIVLCILPFHEFAHGWMANKLGDPTAKWEGRLTMNPLVSVEPLGALSLMLFGFGWAKPVPVDSQYFKKPKRDMAITALAGPVANLIAAFVGALLYQIILIFFPVVSNVFLSFLYQFLYFYVTVNVSLAVFNLIPMPPLDGSRIVGAFLSDRALATYYRYQNMFVMLMFVLMFSGALSGPLGWAQGTLSRAIFSLAGLPFRLFGL